MGVNGESEPPCQCAAVTPPGTSISLQPVVFGPYITCPISRIWQADVCRGPPKWRDWQMCPFCYSSSSSSRRVTEAVSVCCWCCCCTLAGWLAGWLSVWPWCVVSPSLTVSHSATLGAGRMAVAGGGRTCLPAVTAPRQVLHAACHHRPTACSPGHHH